MIVFCTFGLLFGDVPVYDRATVNQMYTGTRVDY